MPKKASTENKSKPKKTAVKKAATRGKKTKKQAKNVVFKIYAPDAQQIYLTGDFNSWDTASLAMIKRDDGVWEIEQELLPGEYQYKYYIDGRWEIDNQQEMRGNEFGTANNIIRID